MIYSVSYSGRSYTTRQSVGGATVGTFVNKTAKDTTYMRRNCLKENLQEQEQTIEMY